MSSWVARTFGRPFARLRLRRQLRRAGAESDEARDLTALTSRLTDGLHGLDAGRKGAIAREVGFKPAHVQRQRRVALAGAFAVCLITVLLSQAANPGSTLYAVKRGTEEVRARVQPGFDREDLVERRKQELAALKRANADDTAIDRAKDELKKAKDRSGKSDDSSGKGRGGSGSDSKGSDDSGNDVSDDKGGVDVDNSRPESGGSGSNKDEGDDVLERIDGDSSGNNSGGSGSSGGRSTGSDGRGSSGDDDSSGSGSGTD